MTGPRRSTPRGCLSTGQELQSTQHDLERPSIPVFARRRSSGGPNEGNRALRMKTIGSATRLLRQCSNRPRIVYLHYESLSEPAHLATHIARSARHDRRVELLQDDGDACAASSRSGRSNMPFPVHPPMPADARGCPPATRHPTASLEDRSSMGLRAALRFPSRRFGRIGVGRDAGIAPGPPQAASTVPHRISWFSGVHGRRDIRVAAPGRVLWPAMRGAAVQFICPVAGHAQVRRY